MIIFIQLLIVNQVRPMNVQERTAVLHRQQLVPTSTPPSPKIRNPHINQENRVHIQSQPIPPTPLKIPHLNALITSRLTLTPQQKPLFRSHALNANIRYSKPQDQRPYKAQNNLAIAINDILSADIGKRYTAGFDEEEAGIDILEALHAHFGAGGIAAEGGGGEDFEEMDQDDLCRGSA